jgi:phosphatidylserine/phosphatidylglycerophosphate/cardiolipin synthase-like enzyme
LIACATPAASTPKPVEPPIAVPALVDPQLELLVTPAPDHAPFVAAIDGAAATLDMTMFHLTDPAVVDALARAARRGVQVRVILDGASLETKKFERVADRLREAGIQVRASSSEFSITHAKAMVVDRRTAFVTAINLTKDVATTRDFGIATRAASVVGDVEQLFDADWDNAAHHGHATPELREPSLVVSPTTSRTKLVSLIGSANHALIATVENLGDPDIEGALVAAAHRGVAVRLIVPMCDKNPDPLHDLPPARRLAAAGVAVRTMPAPETADRPYIHSKMIQTDGAVTYVGSVNFSVNSLSKARELGVIFANPRAAATIAATFEADWAQAVVPPEASPSCPTAP